jgi:hypothetical protein
LQLKLGQPNTLAFKYRTKGMEEEKHGGKGAQKSKKFKEEQM